MHIKEKERVDKIVAKLWGSGKHGLEANSFASVCVREF